MCFVHFDIDQVKTRFTREPLAATVPLVNLTVACVPKKHRAAVNLRTVLHKNVFILICIEGHNVFLHFDIAQVKTRFTREPLVTNVSWVELTVACVPVKYRVAFNLRSFLHESVFFLHIMKGNNDVLHFDITQVKKRFTRDPLVTNAFWVSLTVACVPGRHRAAFNLRSFLHKSDFILLFIEGHDVFLHFDIAKVKTRFTRDPLVTTVSSVNLT